MCLLPTAGMLPVATSDCSLSSILYLKTSNALLLAGLEGRAHAGGRKTVIQGYWGEALSFLS